MYSQGKINQGMRKSLIDRLRGSPLCIIGVYGIFYRQGSLLGVLLALIIAFLFPVMKVTIGIVPTILVVLVGVLFAIVLSVRFELPDDGQI